MARQADRLMKIGLEEFAAIDESFGPAKRPPVPRGGYDRTGCVTKRPPALKARFAHPTNQNPSSNGVAQYYDGVVKEPVITSDEAAEYYGGVAIVVHGRKKPFRSAY